MATEAVGESSSSRFFILQLFIKLNTCALFLQTFLFHAVAAGWLCVCGNPLPQQQQAVILFATFLSRKIIILLMVLIPDRNVYFSPPSQLSCLKSWDCSAEPVATQLCWREVGITERS